MGFAQNSAEDGEVNAFSCFKSNLSTHVFNNLGEFRVNDAIEDVSV